MREFNICLIVSWMLLSTAHLAAQDKTPSKTPPPGFLPQGAVARIGPSSYCVMGSNHSARLSPDGKLLAALNQFDEIELWEVPAWANRRILQPAPPGKDRSRFRSGRALRFSSDGKTLILLDTCNRVQFFDVASGKNTHSFDDISKQNSGNEALPSDVALAADGTFVVVSNEVWNSARQYHVGDLGKGTLTRAFNRHTLHNAVSADCRSVAIVSAGELTLVEAATGKNVWEVKLDCGVLDMAFFPDGKRLLLVTETGLRLYETDKGKELCHQRGRFKMAGFLGHAPDGRSFFLAEWGAQNCTVTRWDAASARQLSGHETPCSTVRQLAWTPEGKILACSEFSYDDTIALLDLLDGKMLSPVSEHWIGEVRFSPEGRLYVGNANNGKANWWNPRSGVLLGEAEPRAPWPVNTDRGSWHFFAKETRTAWLRNDSVRIVDTHSGRETAQFFIPLNAGERASLEAVCEQGRYFAVSTREVIRPVSLEHDATSIVPARLFVWDRETGSIAAAWKNDASGKARLSPDGRWLAYVHADNKVKLRRVAATSTANEKDFFDLGKFEKVRDLLFSPDSKQLTCCIGGGDCLRLFDCASGNPGRVLHGDPGSALSHLTYSADGSLLAGVSRYSTVLVWETGLAADARQPPPQHRPETQAKAPIPELGKAAPAKEKGSVRPPSTKPSFAEEPLPAGALKRLGSTRYRLPEAVYWKGARLSPDGRFLAAFTHQGAIQTWKLPEWTAGPSFRSLPSVQDEAPPFHPITFTADGTLVAYDQHHRLALCDLDSGKFIHYLALPHDYGLHGLTVALSRDRRTLVCAAASNNDGTLAALVYDLAEDRLRRTIPVPVYSFPGSYVPVPLTLPCEADAPRFQPNFRIEDYWPLHALSPDCRWLAVANITVTGGDSDGFSLELWDCRTGKSAHRFDGLSAVKHLAFSPNGQWLAVRLRNESTIRIYDTTSGKEAHNLHQFSSACEPFVFAADSQSLYVAEGGKSVRQWSLATGATLAIFGSPCGLPAQQIAFSSRERERPDAKVLALAQVDSMVYLWEPVSGRIVSPTGVWRQPITHVQFSRVVQPSAGPQTVELFVGSQEGAASWWDPFTGECKRQVGLEGLKYHPARDSLAMIGHGNVLASHDGCGTRVWRNTWLSDITTGKLLFVDEGHRLCLFAGGQRAASLNGTTIRIWDTRDGCDLARIDTTAFDKEDVPLRVRVSENGRYFAVAYDERLLLWDNDKRSVLASWPAATRWRDLVQFSPDNRWLIFPEDGNRLRLIGIGPGLLSEASLDVGEKEWFTWAAFSPTGRELACAVRRQGNDRIVIFEVAGRKIRRELAGRDSAAISCLAYSPDGSLLASGSNDATVLIWRVGLGRGTSEERAADLRTCLEQLASSDAAAAFQGMTQLAARPDEAVKLLADSFAPCEKPDLKGKPLAAWVRALGDDSFALRSEAFALFMSIGPAAASDLRTARADVDHFWTRQRIDELLHKLRTSPLTPQDIVHARAVELAEIIGTPAALVLLRRWSEGRPGAVLTEEARRALERLR